MLELQKRLLPDVNGRGVTTEWRLIIDDLALMTIPIDKYEREEMNRLSSSKLVSDHLLGLSLLASAIERVEQKTRPTHLTQQEGKE